MKTFNKEILSSSLYKYIFIAVSLNIQGTTLREQFEAIAGFHLSHRADLKVS